MKPRVEIVNFSVHSDERGSLIALEGSQDIPFEVRRVYYIYGAQRNIPRGFHAHRHLKQLLVAVSGSVTICCEYGIYKKKYFLNSPDMGLLIEGMVWREMYEFSRDCVLIAFASEHYCESDYIRNYNEFKTINMM